MTLSIAITAQNRLYPAGTEIPADIALPSWALAFAITSPDAGASADANGPRGREADLTPPEGSGAPSGLSAGCHSLQRRSALSDDLPPRRYLYSSVRQKGGVASE